MMSSPRRHIGANSPGVSRAPRSVKLKRNGALQTPISGLPGIGVEMCASRASPTCVDRYGPAQVGQARLAWTVTVRGDPGSAVHRSALTRSTLHRIQDTWLNLGI